MKCRRGEGVQAMPRIRSTPPILLGAAAGGAWVACHKAPAPAAVTPQASALVKTQPLQQRKLNDSVTAFGEVTTGQQVAISFPRAGQVSRLLVVLSQRVKRSAPLATLTSDPGAKLAYTQASTAADFARGELKRNEELFSLQLATQSQVDAARKVLHDAQANLAVQTTLGGAIRAPTVTAPFDGVVTAVAVAEGDRIQPGAAI